MSEEYKKWLLKRLKLYEKQRLLDKKHQELQMALNKEHDQLLKEEPPRGTCPEKK